MGEWTAADDELISLEISDNSTEPVAGEEIFDEQHFCPVCAMDLTGILLVSTLYRGLSHHSPTLVIPRSGSPDPCQPMP